MIDVFGWNLTVALVTMAIAYFVVSLVPVWWPAWRAFGRRPRLPRPFLFVAVVAALVYGVFFLLGCVFLLPLEMYSTFITPEMAAASKSSGSGWSPALRAIRDYGWLVVVIAQFVLTGYVTRTLARRWAHICSPPSPAG
ncbi:hypothetical protein LJR143_003931 [Pseudoxanthomonas sp. LjRoot143]|uniref:hypothetical protein n=1 Tax=Pseudoxanthomonas sp. LjRoot143 TaxID=3342266 RepID=UPI003ECD5620